MEKNRLFMIIIIALLVVLLGVMGWFIVYTMMQSKDGSVTVTTEPVRESLALSDLETLAMDTTIIATLAPSENGAVYQFRLDQWGFNMDSKAKEVKAITEALTAKKDPIASKIIEILNDMTYEDLQGNEGKTRLEQAILELAKSEFNDTSNAIVSVYTKNILTVQK